MPNHQGSCTDQGTNTAPAASTVPATGTDQATATTQGTGTTQGTSTAAAAAQAASTSPTQGSRWKARDSSHPPDAFAETAKLLCDCHGPRAQWPLNNAELIIAPCAYQCPYCAEFNKVGRPRLMASNLRRHLAQTHIRGNPDVYGTLVVAPGVKGRGP
ncbi:hypothetical protein DTO002I6_4451 [Penicillium roqueforti]|nr:hypothetical protein DTO002I6_4451 [Penicillium roqueforti]